MRLSAEILLPQLPFGFIGLFDGIGIAPSQPVCWEVYDQICQFFKEKRGQLDDADAPGKGFRHLPDEKGG